MKCWLSLHIFYFDNLDTLLLDCIEPLVIELNNKNLIERYFFIRYWEGGPHIRLRLFGDKDILFKVVRQSAEQYIYNFLSQVPSTTKIEERDILPILEEYQFLERGENKNTKPLYKNNSIEVIEYIPEIIRYGGDEGIRIAEQYFYYFSQNSFVILKKIANSEQKRLASSLKIMIISLLAFRLSFKKIVFFMRNYNSYWSKYIKLSEHNLENYFLAKYKLQKSELKNLTTILVDYSKSDFIKCKDIALSEAWRINKELFQDLKTINWYSIPNNITYVKNKGNKFDLFLSTFLFSILHMNNNRLGIKPYDESYLAFLIREIFTEFCRKE